MSDGTDELTGLLTGNFSSGLASNGLTILALGLLWSLKRLCGRDSKCKTNIHTCCLDVQVADRTGNTLHQAPVTSDDLEAALPSPRTAVRPKPQGNSV